MRKLIFGIVAVFCLQVTFVAYNAVDRSDVAFNKLADELSSESDPLNKLIDRRVLPSAEILQTAMEEVYAEHDSETRAIVSANTRPRALRIAVRQRSHDRGIVKLPETQPTVASRILAEPRSYSGRNAARREGREATDFALSNQSKRRVGNRSFIARTVPIIKKPYDWLKAFAAKLR